MSGYVPTGGLGNSSMGHKGSVASGDRIVNAYAPPPVGFTEADDSEVLGVFNEGDYVFTRILKNTPVRPGSVKILIDDVDFSAPNHDNGSGQLLGTRFLTGTINYSTGEVRLIISARAHGKTVRAVYATDFEPVQEVKPVVVEKSKNVVERFIAWVKGS